MKFNSIEIQFQKKSQVEHLFAGKGADVALAQKPEGCIRFSDVYDSPFLSSLEKRETEECVFFPVWEEEAKMAFPYEKVLRKIEVSQEQIMSNLRLQKGIMQRNVIRYFRGMGMPCRRDFTGRIEVFEKIGADAQTTEYQKYFLNIRYHDQVGDGWQMDIVPGRKCMVANEPSYRMPEHEDFRYYVVADTLVLRHDRADGVLGKCQGKLYPIVNKEVGRLLGIPISRGRTSNKYRVIYDKAKNFIARYIDTPSFCEQTGIGVVEGGELVSLPPARVKMVEEDAKTLVFGNEQIGNSVGFCFKKYGPYQKPESSQKYFFIYSGKAFRYVCRLYNIFGRGVDDDDIRGSGYSYNDSLHHYVCKSLDFFQSNLSCQIDDESQVLEKLEQHLNSGVFRQDVAYMAIILFDFPRDKVEGEKAELYYRIKYMLLQHNIASQALYKENLDAKYGNRSNFVPYMLPNIAAALVGKLGGIPWKLKNPQRGNDLVIGIGAFREHGVASHFLGTAVCFDKAGNLQDFDTCREKDIDAFRNSIIKAILRFKSSKRVPDRVVIYSYKKMRKKDEEVIDKALRRCRFDCPSYVVNVVDEMDEELVAFDVSSDGLMPPNGTYVELRENKQGGKECLLYNNERFANFGSKTNSFPLPIKLTIYKGQSHASADEEEIRSIMTQAYQFCLLNWKSVSMRSVPITIAYPRLVAKFMPHFPDGILPEWAKHKLWML